MKKIGKVGQELMIKQAEVKDAALAVEFMQKLGTYQKMRSSTTVTEEGMARLLKEGAGEAVFGEWKGKVVAFLYYYENSSAFIGEKGIYIDGFYVEEVCRGQGIGKKMMCYIARVARERGCGRLEWGCLDWNESALKFYQDLGAKGVDIMTIYRLDPTKIRQLAENEE